MHPIDLTEAVTAAARRMYAEHRKGAEKSAQAAGWALPDWPAFDDLEITNQNEWREGVLPYVWAAHRDIARQAWQHGHETPRDYIVDLTLGGEDAHVIVGPPQPNPYDPTMTTDDGGPLGD